MTTSASKMMVVAALCGVVLGGCPQPEPPPDEPCATADDPVLMLANRGGESELSASEEVEVFPPPQGGVFTELDLKIENLGASQLDELRITVDDVATGDSLAVVRYFGEFLPLRCTEDEQQVIDNLPVGFADALLLDDLDGVAAVLTGTMFTSRGEFETRYDVVLRVTDY